MRADHWNKGALKFFIPYLKQARESLQVATGFFTIQGYNLIRSYLSDISVQILVGFDETAIDRLKDLLVDQIMVHLSRWGEENRRAAVLDLVERIRKGRIQVVEHGNREWVDARVRNRDHGKVYILDERVVLSGSVNLTLSGLKYNSENLTLVEDPERVKYYLHQFHKYWNAEDTIDLTQSLLDALLKWLKLSSPLDIYLKTIQSLVREENITPPRDTYKMPVNYQLVVVERALRQLKGFGGAMLVASTGLGKTVMATHIALRLRRENQIYNVIVFSPLQVQPDWRHALRSAGLSYDIFTRNLLDRPGKRKGRKMIEMEEALDQIDEGYLVIIDESQYFRNRTRAKDGRRRQSFNRLIPVIEKKRVKVLLLTATPFSKEVEDLNNQLRLLPHTAEKIFVKADGQFVLPGMMDDAIAPRAWRVMDGPEFFEEFINLPVATVISTSQVAKDFAEHTDEGDFILFGEEKRWVPRVEVTKVKVPVLLEEEVSSAMEQKVFLHRSLSFRDRKNRWYRSKMIIQNKAEISWMSSPLAFRQVIKDTIQGLDDVQYIRPVKKRKVLLTPILSKLDSIKPHHDPKFEALREYLRTFKQEQRKVIVFTERQLTAIYLERALAERLPFLKVANTVKEIDNGAVALKSFNDEVMPLIKGFAPQANQDKISPRDKLVDYDILIATDAYSTGVNLQDASVVINYDLAWTPDVLIQRAGRVLRFWKIPRRVHFLVFVGDFKKNIEGKKKTHNVEKRLRKLSLRGKQAQKFSELPLITEKDRASYDSLGSLSEVTIEDIGVVDIGQLEEFSGVSPFLRHITVLKQNEEYANQIPNDITSAYHYRGDKMLLYLLLAYEKEFHLILYDLKQKRLEPTKEDALLNLIQCTAETPIANVSPDMIERLAQKSRLLWIKQNKNIDLDKVERICSALLIPHQMETSFREMIEDSMKST
ncbi:MAG: helicase-related protein [Bacteroidota bacterium]